ncbi:MAG: hypothetical protein ACRD92_07310 [Nitrosopumilaceae archaeon]
MLLDHVDQIHESVVLLTLQAPYEEPKNPELILDTEKYTPQ